MIWKKISEKSVSPSCALASATQRLESDNTVYLVHSLHFAHPYSAITIKIWVPACRQTGSGTSHIQKHYTK